MSFEHPDQPLLPALFTKPDVPSFAKALQIIVGWADLTETRRRDMASALRTAARMAGRDLANITCDAEVLNGLLFRRSASAHGMGTRRYRSVGSLLRAVLRRLGQHAPIQTGETTLGAAWQDFLAQLPNGPHRAGLRGLARYCDAHAILPTCVNNAALAAFLAHDRETRLSAAIDDQGRSLGQAWKRAVAMQRDPALFQPIHAPSKRAPYTLQLNRYPLSFQQDVERFIAQRARIDRTVANTSPASDAGGAAAERFHVRGHGPFFHPKSQPRLPRWKPNTVISRRFSILQAAVSLHRTGTPIEEILSLRDLVQPIEHAQRILQFYDNGRRLSKGGQLAQLGEVLRQIARHSSGVSEEDLADIEDWAADVTAPRQSEMGAKARQCLLALIQPLPRATLLHLPEELEEQAREPDRSPIQRARLMRVAVSVALLICAPVRITNLQQIRLDQQLVRLNGPRLPSHLIIDPGDVKNEQPLQFPIPKSVGKLIQHFLDDHRHTLAAEGNPFLFAGEDQAPVTTNALRRAFQQAVVAATGVQIYPHVMRHFAAWLHLKTHAGDYEMVRRLLGHRTVVTTRRFYCGLEDDIATEQHDQSVTQEKKATRLIAKAAFKRRRQGRHHRKIGS